MAVYIYHIPVIVGDAERILPLAERPSLLSAVLVTVDRENDFMASKITRSEISSRTIGDIYSMTKLANNRPCLEERQICNTV